MPELGGFIPGGGFLFDDGAPTMGTNDSWPIWGGKTDPGAQVEFEIDGETYSTTADENGTWDFTPPEPLSNGEHDISVKVRDPKTGDESEPVEMTRDVDADATARHNDRQRHDQWESGGREGFRDINKGVGGVRPLEPDGGGGGRGGGGGGGGGTGEHLTTGPTGTQTGSGGGGGGGGGGGSPQPEKGNQARGA